MITKDGSARKRAMSTCVSNSLEIVSQLRDWDLGVNIHWHLGQIFDSSWMDKDRLFDTRSADRDESSEKAGGRAGFGQWLAHREAEAPPSPYVTSDERTVLASVSFTITATQEVLT